MQVIPSNFWQWLNSMDRGDQLPLLISCLVILCVFVVLVVAIVSFTVYKLHKNRLNDALKRDLLERGISSSEIVEIVGATSGADRSIRA